MIEAPLAVVTGGAGGLGSAIGPALASDGYRVVLAGRNLGAAQTVADDIDDALGRGRIRARSTSPTGNRW